MSAPDLVRKAVGFRSWRMEDGKLRSVNGGLPPWSIGRVNEATCLAHLFGKEEGAHPAPHSDCHCGFNVYHDVEGIGQYRDDETVLGAVVGWGRLEVHSDGFRAQFAQPVALAWDEEYTLRQHRLAGEIAHKHGIRYLPLEELSEFALSFGDVVPKGLRPEPRESTKVAIKFGGGSRWMSNITFSGLTISGGNYLVSVEEPSPLLPASEEFLKWADFMVKQDDLYERLTEGVNATLLQKLKEGN